MTVRVAQFEDLSTVVARAERFHAYSPHRALPFDPEGFRHYAADMMLEGGVFLSDEGFAGVAMSRLYFSPSTPVAIELFMHCPREGRALLEAMEDWGRNRGASCLFLSALVDEHEAAIERIYKRAGYGKVETLYLKRL